MTDALTFIGLTLAIIVGYAAYKISPSGWGEYFSTKTDKGILKGIVLVPLAILIITFVLSLLNKAQAQDWHVQIHGLSYHQKRTQVNGTKWNELNYGIGVRYQATKSTDVQLGVFRNSQYNNSVYAITTWLPLEITNSVRIGVFAGTANGYSLNNGNFIPIGGIATRWQGERFSVTSRFLPKTDNTQTSVIAFEFGIKL